MSVRQSAREEHARTLAALDRLPRGTGAAGRGERRPAATADAVQPSRAIELVLPTPLEVGGLPENDERVSMLLSGSARNLVGDNGAEISRPSSRSRAACSGPPDVLVEIEHGTGRRAGRRILGGPRREPRAGLPRARTGGGLASAGRSRLGRDRGIARASMPECSDGRASARRCARRSWSARSSHAACTSSARRARPSSGRRSCAWRTSSPAWPGRRSSGRTASRGSPSSSGRSRSGSRAAPPSWRTPTASSTSPSSG